jgi:hypothetical protein
VFVRRVVLAACAMLAGATPAMAQTHAPSSAWKVPRTPDGRPDLQGTWTNNTATPLARPAGFAQKRYFTPEEAREFERTWMDRLINALPEVDRIGADLSEEWFNRARVVPDLRTSLIVDPENGQLPPQVQAAKDRAAARPPRSYDNPENRSLGERCLLGQDAGGLAATPPMVPNPFAMNYYRIVQTPTHVMIFSELVHDARIVRIGGQHIQPGLQRWMGDSVGRWDGDTLVVDTTNVSEQVHYRGASGRVHVVERFTRTGPSTITYRATVDDPETWAVPWTVEVPFTATTDRLFEYACHEHNYSMELSLRGARADEKAAKK